MEEGRILVPISLPERNFRQMQKKLQKSIYQTFFMFSDFA